ncbi:MAG TPA: hypothetical protein VHL53_04105 [Acidimicrobiia bacterium]|nr:hypothetical protein [Acidimicrobiia bacterium]
MGSLILRRAVVAGVLSGVPSTVHAVATGADPLAAARAAGNLLLPADAPPAALLAAGTLAHSVISLGWAAVINGAVRRSSRPPLAVGLALGLLIAAGDLGLAHSPAGRRWPLVRALPVWPQIADHLAFGALAAVTAPSGHRAPITHIPR